MMENGKRKTENKERFELERRTFSANRFSVSAENFCSACGTEASRKYARFCRVCGKFLQEDYKPLDTLRASYRLQGKSFLVESKRETESLFEENKNTASETAWAFVVYSLVPYIGILFCPGAVLMGGVGIMVSYRKPYLGGKKVSLYSIVLSFVVFAFQIFLWWLLYFIPEIGKQI